MNAQSTQHRGVPLLRCRHHERAAVTAYDDSAAHTLDVSVTQVAIDDARRVLEWLVAREAEVTTVETGGTGREVGDKCSPVVVSTLLVSLQTDDLKDGSP